MSQPLVPTEVVQKLLEGSYEQIAHRVEEAAEAAHVFGEYSGKIKVIGTFNGHAIVVTETAKFAKLLYETSASGELMIVGQEELTVPVLGDTAQLREFYRRESEAIATTFVEGLIDNDRIRELMLAMEGTAAQTDEQIVSNMVEASNNTRPWKLQYDAKEKSGTLQTVLEGWEMPVVTPKFKKLYDGSLDEAEADGFAALVKSDLTKLVGDLDLTTGVVEASFASLTDLVENHVEVAQDESVVDLKSFITDLLEDLMGGQKAIADALEQITTVSALGRLHDALAEGLAQQQAAGEFIFRAVDSVSKAHEGN